MKYTVDTPLAGTTVKDMRKFLLIVISCGVGLFIGWYLACVWIEHNILWLVK